MGVGAEAVGLEAVAKAIGNVLAYLPNVVAALLLLIFGSWAAQAAGKAVATAAEGSGLEFARPWAGWSRAWCSSWSP